MEYQTRSMALPWISLIGGVALGALAMFITDPAQGRRRRALLQDKMTSAKHKTSKIVNQTLRDTRNRLTGLQAEAKRMITARQAKPIDDHVLEARVRSRLGRAMPQLQGLELTAQQGLVTLTGAIPPQEEDHLLSVVGAIPGVEGVRCELQEHVTDRPADWMPALARRSAWWTIGAMGMGLLTWYALTRRDPLGWVAAATGVGLMAGRRSLARTSSEEGMQPENTQYIEGFDVQRIIDISATPEVVFDVWSRYENFPHFMSHVIEVRDLGQNRSHWVMQGASGTEIEFDSMLTAAERPHRLAWHSEPGAVVETEGMVMFAPVSNGTGTRVTVQMSWRPSADAAGKGIALLTGANPDQVLEEDLWRMKQFIERGLAAHESEMSVTAAGRGDIIH